MRGTHQRYRHVTLALSFFIVAHVAALCTMALLLEPGLRPTTTAAARAAYVASHPWSWRLGWLPWQLCAASNLLFSFTLLRWLRSRARGGGGWAAAALVLTVLAVIPEQWAEAVLVTDYIGLARGAVTATGLATFAEKERWVFLMTGPCANTSYTLMTLAWVIALARGSGPVDARVPTWLGVALCIPFAAASVVIYRATRTLALEGMADSIPFNAVAFPLLVMWSFEVAVLMRRMHRADHPHADDTLHQLRPRWLAWLGDLRDLLRPLPFVELHSDIRDVVYLNWLVPAERAARLLPPGLELDRFGNRTVLSILTYTHGSFGPRAAGPLRKLLPSPHQSNWRFYVEPRGSVYFVSSLLSSLSYTIGSRLMSDGLPAHHAASFVHRRDGDAVHSEIEASNALDLRSTVTLQQSRELPPTWADAFAGWEEAVTYLVEQNRAVAPLPMLAAVVASNIDIPIRVQDVLAARGEVQSAWLADLTAGCELFCFVVPSVSFRALGEERLPQA